MFLKQFKLKSNVQMKGSETKKLKTKLQQFFGNISNEEVALLIPNKSTVNQIKLNTHSGNNVNVYCVDKRPMFFDDENEIIPTLYALWILPKLLPYFTTHDAVLPKLSNGADLMLPGVIRQGDGLYSYGNYKKNHVVAVNLTSNSSAVGIGRLARSSADLYMCGGHGTCVKMLHVFGDKLWGIEPSVALQIPGFQVTVPPKTDEDFPALPGTRSNQEKEDVQLEKLTINDDEKENNNALQNTTMNEETDNNEKLEKTSIEVTDVNVEDVTNLKNVTDNKQIEAIRREPPMDKVLKDAFLNALKYNRKELVLPLLSSTFYRSFVLPSSAVPIDLKQTSYKKLSKFLNVMSEKSIIVLREELKGVEKIVSIDFDHPDIVNFIPDDNASDHKIESNSPQLFHSEMTELYLVTEETIGLFTKYNYRKEDGLTATEVKKILKDYVSKNKLPFVDNTKVLKLDETLAQICNTERISLSDLHNVVLSKMHYAFKMTGKHEISGNKPLIQLSIATRSGNKKVTLVSNLEAYSVILSEFAKACKLGAAASTTIVQGANQKQTQLQIQGNQIRFIYNLLTETYKIPPKQIIGLDLAKKEKKRKN